MIREMEHYLVASFVLSIITFCSYGWDKRQAKLDRWRIPERTLQGLALFGGWPGAILAQSFFRHKTQKRSFQIMFWLIVVLHIFAIGCLIAESSGLFELLAILEQSF